MPIRIGVGNEGRGLASDAKNHAREEVRLEGSVAKGIVGEPKLRTDPYAGLLTECFPDTWLPHPGRGQQGRRHLGSVAYATRMFATGNAIRQKPNFDWHDQRSVSSGAARVILRLAYRLTRMCFGIGKALRRHSAGER